MSILFLNQNCAAQIRTFFVIGYIGLDKTEKIGYNKV